MGTHPIFESDFDCLTEMVVEDVRESDLRAFEERLKQSIESLNPYAAKWRICLCSISLLTIISAYIWLNDPKTSNSSLLESLGTHPYFLISSLCLALLFFFGVHKRVVAPSILVQRLRYVLADFGLSVTENGSLIVKNR